MKLRVELGIVAVDKQGNPHTGSHYSGGAKVYQSEAIARAAMRKRVGFYNFLPAFVEVDVEEPVRLMPLEEPNLCEVCGCNPCADNCTIFDGTWG
jgi:hypothetical protein